MVFEGLAENLLSTYAGKFFGGIETKNLSVAVLSGKVAVKNVFLKPDAVASLGLPFNLKFSSIGQIDVTIPWKSIGNSPGSILIDGILVVVEPKDQKDWVSLSSKEKFLKKHEEIMSHAKNQIEKYMEALKNKGKSEKSESYMGKVIQKCIDNLQVTIKNIHLRLESHNGQKSFDFGVTLDTISLQTVNEKGEKDFIDRTKAQNKSLPLFKNLIISNFAIYWNTNESKRQIESLLSSEGPQMSPESKQVSSMGASPLKEFEGTPTKEQTTTAKEQSTPIKGNQVQRTPLKNVLKASNELDEDSLKNYLLETIYSEKTKGKEKRINYLLKFSISTSLTQHPLSKDVIERKVPLNKLELSLDQIYIELSDQQLKSILNFLEICSSYQLFLKKEKEKENYEYLKPFQMIREAEKEKRKEVIRGWWKFAQLSVIKRARMQKGLFGAFFVSKAKKTSIKENFRRLFEKIQRLPAKNTSVLDPETEFPLYRYSCMSLAAQELKEEADVVLKRIQKDFEITEKEKMKNKKPAFDFKLFGSKQMNSELLKMSPEEIKEIEDFINKEFSSENSSLLQLPEDYPTFEINLHLSKGSVALSSNFDENQKETLELEYSRLHSTVVLYKMAKSIKGNLENVKVELISQVGNGTVKTPVLLQKEKEEIGGLLPGLKDYFSIDLEFSPFSRPGLDLWVNVDIASVDLIFRTKLIRVLKSIFYIEPNEEVLSVMTSDAFDEFKSSTGSRVSEMLQKQVKKEINIRVDTAKVILPFIENSSSILNSWVFELGGFSLHTDSREEIPEEKIYQKYSLLLKDIRFDFTGQFAQPISPLRRQADQPQSFSVIEKFSLEIEVAVLKEEFLAVFSDKAKCIVSAKIDQIQLKTTKRIYDGLVSLGKMFSNEESLDQGQLKKQTILKTASRVSYLHLMRGSLNQWEKLFCVFSGSHLYFFEDSKAVYPSLVFSLRKSEVKRVDEMESGRKNTIKIEGNRKLVLSLSSQKIQEEWMDLLVRKTREIKDFSVFQKNEMEKKAKENQELKLKVKALKQVNLRLLFLARSFSFLVVTESQANQTHREVFEFSLKSLSVSFESRNLDSEADVSLQEIEVKDYQSVPIPNDKCTTVLTSVYEKSIDKKLNRKSEEKTDKPAIFLGFKEKSQDHPEFKGVEKQVDLELGRLFLIVNPNSFVPLFQFFTVTDSEDLEEFPAPSQRDKPPSESLNSQKEKETSSLLKKESPGAEKPSSLAPLNPKTKSIWSYSKLLLMSINSQEVSLTFVHAKNDIFLGTGKVQRIQGEISISLPTNTFKFSIYNVQLFDLTNYPNTITSARRFFDVRPQEFLGKDSGSSEDSVISIEMSLNNRLLVPLRPDGSDATFNLAANGLKLLVYSEPIQRYSLYVKDQIIFTLKAIFKTGHRVQQQKNAKKRIERTSSAAEEAKLLQKAITKIQNKSTFTSFDMKVLNTRLVIQGPDCPELIDVILEAVTLTNGLEVNPARIPEEINASLKSKWPISIEGIWCRVFYVNVSNISIRYHRSLITGNQKGRLEAEKLERLTLVKPFDLSMKIEMPMRLPEYKKVFNAVWVEQDFQERDSSALLFFRGGLEIKAKATPVVGALSKIDYSAFWKLLNTNLTYNDQKGKFFSFSVRKLKENLDLANRHGEFTKRALLVKENKETSNKKPKGDLEIQFEIEIEAIVVLLLKETPENQKEVLVEETNEIKRNNGPVARISTEKTRVIFKRKANSEKVFWVHVLDFVTSAFLKKSGVFLEKGILGKLSIAEMHKCSDPQEFLDDYMAQIVTRSDEKDKEELGKDHEEGKEPQSWSKHSMTELNDQESMLSVQCTLVPNGEKDVVVQLRNAKFLIHQAFFQAFEILKVGSEVQAQESSLSEKEMMDLESMLKHKPLVLAKHKPKAKRGPGDLNFRIKILMKDNQVFALSQNQNDSVAIQGDFEWLISRNNGYEDNAVIQEAGLLRGKEDALKDFTKSVMEVNLKVKELKLFLCEFNRVLADELAKTGFPIRNILLPCTLLMSYKEHLGVGKSIDEELGVFTKKELEVEVDNAVFRVHFQDYNALKGAFELQKEIYQDWNRYRATIEKEASFFAKRQSSYISQVNVPNYQLHSTNQSVTPLTKSPENDQNQLVRKTEIEDAGSLSLNRSFSILKSEKKKPMRLSDQLFFQKISLEKFQMVFINDYSGIFAPVFNVLTLGAVIKGKKCASELVCAFALSISAFYFNSKIFRWEPVIEKTSILSNLGRLEGKTRLQIELNSSEEILDLVICPELLADTSKAVDSCKKIFKESKENSEEMSGFELEKVQVETLARSQVIKFKPSRNYEQIAPYKIVNQTGYPITIRELETDSGDSKRTRKTSLGSSEISKYMEDEKEGLERKREITEGLSKPKDLRRMSDNEGQAGCVVFKEVKEEKEALGPSKLSQGKREAMIEMQELEKEKLNRNIGPQLLKHQSHSFQSFENLEDKGMLIHSEINDKETTFDAKTLCKKDNEHGNSSLFNMNRRMNHLVEFGDSTNIDVNEEIHLKYAEDIYKQLSPPAYIEVKVHHSSIPIQPIYNVDLNRMTARKCCLSGSAKLSSTFLVISPTQDKEKRTIVIGTKVAFVNHAKETLHIRLFKRDSVKKFLLKNEENIFVPFDFVDSSLILYLDGREGAKQMPLSLGSLVSSQELDCQVQVGEKCFMVLMLERNPEAFNQTTIHVSPVLTITNCLPFTLYYQLDSEELEHTGGLAPGERLEEFGVNYKRKTSLKIRCQGHRWSESLPLIDAKCPCLPSEIYLKDKKKNQGKISTVFSKKKYTAKFPLLLFSDAIILNETLFPLRYVLVQKPPGKDTMSVAEEVSGQEALSQEKFDPKLVMTRSGDDLSFLFSLSTSLANKKNSSSRVPTNSLLFSHATLQQGEQEICFSVNRVLREIDYELYTKVIVISPRYVLVNNSKHCLKIKQHPENPESLGEEVVLEASQRCPYDRWDKQMSKALSITTEINGLVYKMKSGFDFNELGAICFVLFNEENCLKLFFKVSVKMEKGIQFGIITETDEENSGFIVRNLSSIVSLEFYQFGHEKQIYKIRPKESSIFAWAGVQDRRIMKLTAKKNEEVIGTQMFDFIKINTSSFFKKNDVILELATVVSKVSKTLQVKDISLDDYNERMKKQEERQLEPGSKEWEAQSKKDKENSRLIINFNLSNLGLSLIGKYGNRRKEVLYTYFSGLEFVLATNETQRQLQMRIRYMNIDLNAIHDTVYPVFFTPTIRNSANKGSNSQEHFLNIFVVQRTNISEDLLAFDECAIDIKSFKLRAEQILLSFLPSFFSELQNAYQKTEHTSYTEKYFSKETQKAIMEEPEKESGSRLQEEETKKEVVLSETFQKKEKSVFSDFEWFLVNPSSTKKKIYLVSFRVQVLNINLSFLSKQKSAAKEEKDLIQSVGITLPNIDGAFIKLNGLRLEHVYESFEGIRSRLYQHYRAEALKSLLRLIGAAEFLGNPVGLFKNIGSGVADVFEKPYEGFIKGPLEGGLGLIQGGKSLVFKTVSGVSNSLGKITGSLATGISGLTMDEEFLREREVIQRMKPKGMGESVDQGLSSLATGFGHGIIGIFKKPIEGAKTGGFFGFTGGIFRGATGLITKSATGVFDAGSKLMEGIKSETSMSESNDTRERPPRVFYGVLEYFKSYSREDAVVVEKMRSFKKGKYQNNHYVFSETIFRERDLSKPPEILIFTNETVLLVCAGKLSWDIEPSNLRKVTQCGCVLSVELMRKTKKISEMRVSINCGEVKKAKVLLETFEKLRDASFGGNAV